MIFKNFQISAHNSHENGTFSGNAGLVIRGFIHPPDTPRPPNSKLPPSAGNNFPPPNKPDPKFCDVTEMYKMTKVR